MSGLYAVELAVIALGVVGMLWLRREGDRLWAEHVSRRVFVTLTIDTTQFEAGMVPEATGNGAVSDLGPESGLGDHRDDEGRSGAREWLDCTCGHPNADHENGACPFKGCGCGAIYDDEETP